MRCRIVVAAASRLGKDFADKTPEELEVIIHDEMRSHIVVAAASRLGKDFSAKTHEELEVIIHNEMRSQSWWQLPADSVKTCQPRPPRVGGDHPR